MYRTHTCGELRIENVGQTVTLCGWVQLKRDKGGMIWIDLRDRYGITQLAAESSQIKPELLEKINKIGREYVIRVTGEVIERYSKNDKIETGDIEIKIDNLDIMSESEIPPFTIIDNTDGGDDLRMKYRYLDIRRSPVKNSLIIRHKIAQEIRKYLSSQDFIEIETPYLINSTPEGARDFVVPSRMNRGEFYALPQSPQTFKQLLMVAGMDRYFQIVKCFRDEDLRADRQPEFTQIDCEMSFVEQEDVLNIFENMMKHLFKNIRGVNFDFQFPRMTWHDAMKYYGSDKPDTRFDMKFVELTDIAKNRDFAIFNEAEIIIGINAKGCSEYTRKELDALTDFVKRPQVGAKGLVYVKCNADGTYKSSVDKFYNQEDLAAWAKACNASAGDLILILSGNAKKTRFAMCALRLEMGTKLGLRDNNKFSPLWVVDFPLLEWDDETQRFYAMHHPFTSPKPEDADMLESKPGDVRANAYDMVVNGVELGGGSIRIFNQDMQKRMFKAINLSDEDAQVKFGYLLNAFKYGAPPHGGLAFGFDRLCAMFGGSDSIRDYIAFPKNNAGRDVMANSPAQITQEQLNELGIKIIKEEK